MRKYKVIACLIIVLKNIIFIPVYITGGIAGVHLKGYITLYGYLSQEKGCCDFFNYSINYLRFFIELIILGLIFYLIYLIIKMFSNKKKTLKKII